MPLRDQPTQYARQRWRPIQEAYADHTEEISQCCQMPIYNHPLLRAAISMTVWLLFFSLGVSASLPAQTPAQPPQQPEFVKVGQQLIRDGKAEEALALYRQTLQTSPDSAPANIAAGKVLDLMGNGQEARKYFSKAIDVADTPEHKAGAQRAMAMSYAFEEIATRQSSTSNRPSISTAA